MRVAVEGDVGASLIAQGIEPPKRRAQRIVGEVLAHPWRDEASIHQLRQWQAFLLEDLKLHPLFKEILAYFSLAQTEFGENISPLRSMMLFGGLNQDSTGSLTSASEDELLNYKVSTIVFITNTHELKKLVEAYLNSTPSDLPAVLLDLLYQVFSFLQKIETIIERLTIGSMDQTKTDTTLPADTSRSWRKQLTEWLRRLTSSNRSFAEEDIEDDAPTDEPLYTSPLRFGSYTTYCNLEGNMTRGGNALIEFCLDIERCSKDFNTGAPLFANDQLAPYWIKLLCTLVCYQNRFVDWMEYAGLSNDGAIRASGIVSPVVAIQRNAGNVILQPEINIEPHHRLVVITGPNTGGKTELMRAIAQLHIHRQIGSRVFGKKVSVPNVDKIFSHRSMEDGGASRRRRDTQRIPSVEHMAGDDPLGSWAREVQALATIRDQAGPDSLILIDEILLGTHIDEQANQLIMDIIEALLATGARVLIVTHQFGILDRMKGREDTILLRTTVGNDGKPTYQFKEANEGFTEEERIAYNQQREQIVRNAGFECTTSKGTRPE